MDDQKVKVYGMSLIGTPYGEWKGGPLTDGSPMWSSDTAVPKLVDSTSCAGLLNLMFRFAGIKLPVGPDGSVGGTYAYGHHFGQIAESFDSDKKYPDGTIIGRRYRNENDQGHVAIIYEDMLLQSIFGEGVNMKYTMGESHAGWYYEYAVTPHQFRKIQILVDWTNQRGISSSM